MASDSDRPFRHDATSASSRVAWSPSLSCNTWHDAHQTAASMQRSGVLLRTPNPPPVGAGVHLTLRLPDQTDIVLVGDVVEVMAAEGAVVRFRVALPIVTQLEARAWSEERGAPRPATPLARGSLIEPPAAQESGTTYAIHRKPKPKP